MKDESGATAGRVTGDASSGETPLNPAPDSSGSATLLRGERSDGDLAEIADPEVAGRVWRHEL